MRRTQSRFPWRPVRAVANLLVSFVLTLPGIVLGQAPATARSFLDLIQATETQAGIYDAALIEPLMSLGALYREQGSYRQSAEVLVRARELLRINHGLSTLEEVQVLDALVLTAEAQGDVVLTQEYEQALLTVAQQHIGAMDTYAVFVNLADKRMNLLNRYLAAERPPQIYAGCYYAKTIDYQALGAGQAPALVVPQTKAKCGSGDRPVVQRALLIEAIAYQGWALEALLQNGHYASDEMLALMQRFFRSSNQLHRVLSFGSEYIIGPMWNRALGFEATTAAERVRRAQLQLQLADLNLLRLGRDIYFDDYGQLYDQYRKAYQHLAAEGVDAETLDRLFAPEFPVRLPASRAFPFFRASELQEGAWIEASFEVDERGKSRRIRITDKSEGITRAEGRDVERLIRESRFRPRLVAGSDPARTQVVVRYPLGGVSLPQRPPVVIEGIELR